MITIQEFALKVSLSVCPDYVVEPFRLKKWWRDKGARELEKYFFAGYIVNYDQEIDWKAISDHKKQMWYDSQNFQIQAGNEYSKRQG
jgi:hypothetical protein